MDFDLAMASSSCSETLLKFAAFLLVQALVYLILSQSSGVFSSAGARRSPSFRRPARSASLRRMVALLSDTVAGGVPPSPVVQQREGGSTGSGVDIDLELEIELMLIGCSFSS